MYNSINQCSLTQEEVRRSKEICFLPLSNLSLCSWSFPAGAISRSTRDTRSALFGVCHELMHSAKVFNRFLEITPECPFLTAIWVPLIQSKPDVIALCPFKIVNKGPVEHAPHINAVPDCSCDLHNTTDRLREDTSKPQISLELKLHVKEHSQNCLIQDCSSVLQSQNRLALQLHSWEPLVSTVETCLAMLLPLIPGVDMT